MQLIEKILFVVALPITFPIALISAIVLICTVRNFSKQIEKEMKLEGQWNEYISNTGFGISKSGNDLPTDSDIIRSLNRYS